MPTDFYSTLGVSRSASPDDIKAAYRKLSKEWHPDKHKGDKKAEEKFKGINEAYEVLSDPKKKQQFDQFGTTGSGPGSGSGGFNPGGGFGGFDFSGFSGGERVDFSDLFEGFFGGGGRGRQRQQSGADHEVNVEIDFAESVTGKRQTIRLRRLSRCTHCKGSGAEPGSNLKTCDECGGTGQVVRSAQSFLGMMRQAVVCPKCRGSGKIPEKPCTECRGEGRKAEDASITVEIPAGIDDGQTLRVREEGDAGKNDAPPGDLLVHIHVRSDKRFVRAGDDVRSEIIIGIPDAVLGIEAPVETVLGKTTLKIPAGTQSGQVFRIKHKGMPVLNTSRFGDHYVTVTVEVPAKLSREERKLVEEWKRLRDGE